MNYIDFEYNGHKLSEYGCMVCHIQNSAGTEAVDTGSQIQFHTVSFRNENNSYKFKLLNSEYESTYAVSFEICKMTHNDQKQMYFSEEETTRIIRWLNQKQFHKFKMIDSDGQCANVFYNGSFNVKPIALANRIIGISLDFISDAPFGFYEPIHHFMDFSVDSPFYTDCNTDSNTLDEYILYDPSDEAGYIYPDQVEIEILEDGNLTVHNSLDSEDVIVHNCSCGEIITLNGKNKIIQSSRAHPGLYNDFNYHFLKVINNCDECDDNDSYSKNIYTVSLKCRISFSYSPIAKIGVIP